MLIYVHVCTFAVLHTWRSKDSLQELFISSHQGELRDQTQVVRLRGESLHPRSPLAGLWPLNFQVIHQENERKHRVHAKATAFHPFSPKCTLRSRVGRLMGGWAWKCVSLWLLTRGAWTWKDLENTAFKKCIFYLVYGTQSYIIRSKGWMFSVIVCQGLFITIPNNFPVQITPILSCKRTCLPHPSCWNLRPSIRNHEISLSLHGSPQCVLIGVF